MTRLWIVNCGLRIAPAATKPCNWKRCSAKLGVFETARAKAGGSLRGRVRAFSLAETAVSTIVVGVMLVAALNTVGASRVSQRKTGDRTRGMLLAQQMMTEILQQHYEEPGGGGFGLNGGEAGDGSRSLWDDVDDYDGWSASPPERKNGTVMANFGGWERNVSVDRVKPDDLQSPTGTERGVKRITVIVKRNNVPVASLVAIRTIAWRNL